MANAAQVLQQAHDLIEAGDYQAARQILDAVRSSNENNPDFWWVYAHAVDDATEGKAAIERVRQLAPNYAGLESLVAGSPSPVSTIKPLRPLAPPPPMATKAASEEDEFGDTEEESEKKPNRMMPILGGMLLVLLIAIVLIMVLNMANNINNQVVTPERTPIVDNFATPLVATSDSQAIDLTETTLPSEEAPIATEEVVETEVVETEVLATATEEEAVEPTATEEEIVVTEDATEEVTTTDFTQVIEDLADFAVPSEGIVEESTSLGETLVVTTCTTPGPAASGNILGILDAFKAAGVSLSTEAIAFNVTDCSSDSVIISLGISSELVESYWLGDTTAAELLAALRRL